MALAVLGLDDGDVQGRIRGVDALDADFDIDLGVAGSPDEQRVSATAPMPTFGALGTLTLGEYWTLGADLNLFIGDFDRYDGLMAYLGLDLDRRFGDVFRVGVGYNVYALRLDAKDSDLGGRLNLTVHGPKAYVSLTF